MKVLKIGDPVYSQSFRSLAPARIDVFPQREQFLLENAHEITFDVFHHRAIQSVEDVALERVRFTDFIKTNRFDAVMVDNPLSALVIGEAGLPIIFDCIDWYDEVYLKEFGIDKCYYLLRYGLLDLCERAQKVIAQSPVILSALKSWGLRTDKTLVIPNGFDDSLFYPRSSEEISKARQRIAQRHNVQLEGKTLVVFTGRLSPWYEAIGFIAEAISDSQVFFVVGDGPVLQQIPDKPNVVKCGALPRSEVPIYTTSADVLVFPADHDCSPIVVSEYLALGKPIVMPKGRISWLLKDGVSGALVDNNIYGWKRGIERARQTTESAREANLRLAGDLSWRVLGEKFSNFVRS